MLFTKGVSESKGIVPSASAYHCKKVPLTTISFNVKTTAASLQKVCVISPVGAVGAGLMVKITAVRVKLIQLEVSFCASA